MYTQCLQRTRLTVIAHILVHGLLKTHVLLDSIQCVPEKIKPINQVNFSENCKDLSEKVYIVTKIQFFLFLLTPVTRCIGHA